VSASPLARAASLFLAPRPARAPRVAPPPPCARAVVLGAAGDARAAAGALANALRAGAAARTALVAVWEAGAAAGGAPGGEAPAGRAAMASARRLATGLATRGLPAVAGGRVAWLALPADADAALAAAARASAAVPEPVVLALAGPRPAALAAVVADADLVVLVPPPAAPRELVALAVDELAAAGRPVAVQAPLRGAARRLALAGWGRLGEHPAPPIEAAA